MSPERSSSKKVQEMDHRDLLLLVENILGSLASDASDEGRRVYLAYLVAVEGRTQNPERRATIEAMREVVGV